MVEQAKTTQGNEVPAPATVDTTKYVPKEEFDKVSTTVEALKGELDKAKMSLLDPDYIAYMESKQKPAAKAPPIDIANLPKETVEALKEHLMSEIAKPLQEELARTRHSLADITAVLELQETEKKHKDFNDYRDDIKTIIETSAAPLTFEQAYLIAKANRAVKSEPDTKGDDKAKGTEKPTRSIPHDVPPPKTFKSKEDAAADAWDKVVGSGKDSL